MSLPAVGDLAPEVTLPDDAGVIHRIEKALHIEGADSELSARRSGHGNGAADAAAEAGRWRRVLQNRVRAKNVVEWPDQICHNGSG